MRVKRAIFAGLALVFALDLPAVRAESAARAPSPAPGDYVVNFAYFPYSHLAEVRVDLTHCTLRPRVKTIDLAIQRRGLATPLATRTMAPSTAPVREESWPLPDLGEGEYELVVRLDGVEAPEKRVDFVRHVFPWEHNTLGRSDAIVPPFTPLRVEGRTVDVVLRRHTLDELGLWRQVSSEGKNLFTRPMRLEIERDGKTETVAARSFRFAKESDNQVVTEAGFDGGTARGEWDYDGVMRWTLDLAPDPRPIDAMTLVISLDDRLTPLMHACTDGIRINYAGDVPAGDGRVWDGGKAKHWSLTGSYVPYIWVGGEERGLAVFGDNDRGWVTAKGVPCQELRRTGGTLELRLNLIAQRTVIAVPTSIALGFQATPTKPMPANWRLWSLGGPSPHDRSAPHFAFLGSCLTWGALTGCTDVYPRDEDFSLWDEFREARRTGKFDPAEISRWLGKIADQKERRRAAPDIAYAFRVLAYRPDKVLVYTNPRGVRFDTPEGRTFLNEWDRRPFPKRNWKTGEGVWFDANVSESFRDYCVWHYKKMLTTFDDGIYWDDTFLQSTFVPVGTDVYVMANGKVQPSAGLWAMRALIRRTAVLDDELQRPPLNMLHTTNAAIAPILSFGQMLLTWEDQKGDKDFQDRHTRAYLRAESIGRQHGVVPFGMFLRVTKDPAKAAWINRTGTGVALVHEIKINGSIPEWYQAYERLVRFGYGQPAVRVFNYWDKDDPVTVTGTDAATLCLSKTGAAMVVVCDYGGGGALELKLNRSELGLNGRLTARNDETGDPLPVAADGAVSFQLKRHDYCIIIVSSGTVADKRGSKRRVHLGPLGKNG